MANISTSYLGLSLKSPLVASASPLSKKLENVVKLEDAGIGALVVYSLFEEQIIHEQADRDHFLSRGSNAHPEAQAYFPDLGSYNLEPDRYLAHLSAIRKSVKIPVIGSLNGVTRGGWTEWARRIEETGVNALELNVYSIPTDPVVDGVSVENQVVDLVAEVVGKVGIPVSVKLSPFYSSIPNLVARIGSAGAKGVVLFNRFLQPDLDPENLSVMSAAKLSDSSDLSLPLRWTAILSGRVAPQIALSGGVATGRDLLKALLAGAQVGQVASAILSQGSDVVGRMLTELGEWMDEQEYESVDQLRGSMSQKKVADPAAFERAQYMRALTSLDDRFV
ncbi:MAG: dihydroorotate dehydrogenase-like protein [Fibrobacterota bacterium]|nr:dihydroorotate dehydrogenase-like protein [Fibrobacterota bacterium]QQS04743.1 MAG: dihydroorotate dehydrogenase-like protein [Fibrobacterota bacterium]